MDNQQQGPSWEDISESMQGFVDATTRANAIMSVNNREMALFSRQVRLLTTGLTRLNSLITTISTTRTAQSAQTNRQGDDRNLTEAIRQNTSAVANSMRAIAANTVAMRTFALLATASAVTSAGAAVSTSRSASRTENSLGLQSIYPVRDNTNVGRGTVADEEKRQRRKEYDAARRRKQRGSRLDRETSRVLGVPIEYPPPQTAVPGVPLERPNDYATPEHRRATATAMADDYDRQKDAEFRKKHNLPEDFDLNPTWLDYDEKEMENAKVDKAGNFDDVKSMRKAMRMHRGNKSGQRSKRMNKLENDLAAEGLVNDAANAGTPPVPPVGGSNPAADSGVASRGSEFQKLLAGILSQVTKLTTAATTNSTIYVYDTHNEKHLQALLAGMGTLVNIAQTQQQQSGPTPTDTKNKKSSMASDFNDLSNSALAATTSMIGMTAIANPSVFSTFTGSIKLLVAEIGTAFVPMVREMAYKIQDLTDWFGSFSDETKRTIGIVGLGVAAFAGLSIGIRGLASAFGTLGTAASLGLKTIGLLFNPATWAVVGGIAALTAGVALATGNWNNLTAAIWKTGEALSGVGSVAKNTVNAVAGVSKEKNLVEKLKDINSNRVRESLLKAESPAEIEKVANTEIARIEKEIADKQKMLPAEARDRVAGLKARNDLIASLRGRMARDWERAKGAYMEDMTKRLEAGTVNLGGGEFQEYEQALTYSSFLPESAAKKFGYTQTIKELELMVTRGDRGISPPFSQQETDRTVRGTYDKEQKGYWRPQNWNMLDATAMLSPLELSIRDLRKLISGIKGIASDFGVDANKNRINDLVSPVQAKYTDAMSYRESAQLQALNVVDTQTKLAEQQIAELYGIKSILDAIRQIQLTENERIVNALREIGLTQP